VHSILTKLGVHRRAEVISLLAKRSDAEVAENQSLLQLTPK